MNDKQTIPYQEIKKKWMKDPNFKTELEHLKKGIQAELEKIVNEQDTKLANLVEDIKLSKLVDERKKNAKNVTKWHSHEDVWKKINES